MNHVDHHDDGIMLDKHSGHHTEDFLTKFWVSLILTIPIVLYSDLPSLMFEWKAPVFSGSNYLSLILGSIIFFYGGVVFLKGAIAELRARLPGMMTLISLAITTAYLYSVWSVFIGGEMTLFWELSTLIVIMLLGHWIEMKAVQTAKGALHELAKLLPDGAEIIENNKTRFISIDQLQKGMIVIVRPGGKVPVDGIVTSGSSELDESLITGESRPVLKAEGDEVIAGSINGDGSIQIQVDKMGNETFLAGIMKLVSEAENSKSKLQLLSDKAAFYLTLLAITSGAITVISWLYIGQSTAFAVERLVSVLVIACPHALGLAIPLVASISTTMAAKNGFFIKRRIALETARNITTVLFDKTGTLTKGMFGVFSVIGNQTEVIALAASVNSLSEHPLAKAIVSFAQKNEINIDNPTSFIRLPGKGVSAVVGDKKVIVGSKDVLVNLSVDQKSEGLISKYENEGKTVVHVVQNDMYVGSIALADMIREESIKAVRELKAMNIHVAMITGDSIDVAKWVSEELGISEYYAQALPEKKANIIKDLQSRNEIVAMVGDGINDAPALTQADLGIAIGAGTNVAIESAGIILVKSDPQDIPKIIKLSRLTYSKMIQNLMWATGYNVIALPVAAGALYVYGVMLQPAFSAVLMSLSTIIVAINASLLKRKEI